MLDVNGGASSVDSKLQIEKRTNAPGVLLMQWLTYAFWWLFAFGLMWLTIYVASYFVTGADAYQWGGTIAYPLAAVIVLLLIALTADIFYARKEPVHKTGGATVIMLVHAVIFALSGIAALVTAVFAVINMSINTGVSVSGDGSKVALYTALVLFVVYLLLGARTVFVGRVKHLVKITWVIVGVIATVIVGMGIAGPAVWASATKQDRLIEAALPTIAYNISTYAVSNNKLPASLADITVVGSSTNREQVKIVVGQNLVKYTPNTRPAVVIEEMQVADSARSSVDYTKFKDPKLFYYRLCTTYSHERKNSYDDYSTPYAESRNADKTVSSVTIDASKHAKGEVCYNLQTSYEYAYGEVEDQL